MRKEKLCQIFELKITNNTSFSMVSMEFLIKGIPSSNVRLIPQRGGKRWVLSSQYRKIKQAIKDEISKKIKEGEEIKIKDWAKGVISLEHIRRAKGFTRDIDNFLKIIIDGVFSAFGLDDKILRIVEVSLRESDYMEKDRKRVFGTLVSLSLEFYNKEVLDRILRLYEDRVKSYVR